MRNYEDACTKYNSKLRILPLPLVSWEFSMDYFQDLFSFRKIQESWVSKQDFLKKAQIEEKELIITDSNFKIVYASKNIASISGYQSHEIIGKSPTMFQGADTSVATRAKIKQALVDKKPFKEILLNYRKNGDTYWCEIEAYPMFDKEGVLQNYIALEKIAS